MTQLFIATPDGRTDFSPGQRAQFSATWEIDADVQRLEARLLWRTSGKGTQSGEVVAVHRFDNPSPKEFRPFEMVLPPSPYSFSGRLVSIEWYIELVILPGEQSNALPIVIGPGGREVRCDHGVPKTS
jgi:hypothetical protein